MHRSNLKIALWDIALAEGLERSVLYQNHFVSFLPSKIPMEFWNFGILFCKSLISLKKVDSNFTLRIRPLYIKTQKFQFRVSFLLIPKFQLACSSSKQGWNLGIWGKIPLS